MLHSEEYLGVDVGAARVGVARGSSLAKIAEPLADLPAVQAIDGLAKLAAENQAKVIVVGLPRSLDGNDTPQTEAVRRWVNEAREKIRLPFYWQDEALTSQLAEKRESYKSQHGTDAAAAAIILQDFFDTPLDERVRC